MIKFKNINGDVFLAVGSIKRKSALNGEKLLSGTLFEGNDVLNKIDKGWSLEFDNEPYVVTYFERNDNDNTVEFDAIHKFFWDMNKSVLYSSSSGSHTAKWYLDQIFNGTGYRYALNFEPSAFEKENWGMKNKLSLFNDAISGMGGEFEINGTLVSVFKNVGSDLSTIVRHGFNLSDMSLENDNTDFVTYGEGFGAYADQENQTGPRLHVTYTSPLAKIFGKLHAEPIDDQRYSVQDNLLQVIKDKVDGSFAISIKLSLYDLTAAGYPYKMANVGDWLLAIDENLDFKQKIRIISVDDEFATDGTRILYTVTCGDVGVVQKYQQANASLGQKVESAYQDAQAAKESSVQAVIAANGKNTNYYVDGIDNLPETANEGDVTFVQTGDGQAMYIYTKLPDGSFKWVKRLDPDTGEQIAAGVDEVVATANSQAAAMDKVQADNLNNFKSEHAEQLASAAAVAQNAANSAADEGRHAAQDAKKYADSAASEALSDANIALSEAETRITISASSTAHSMADSAASAGVTAASVALSSANFTLATAKSNLTDDISTAKSEAIESAKTADGLIHQEVTSTAASITETISQNKSETDGKISTAQTTATQALNGLSNKVSQTDYDKKTGDLDKAVGSAALTADSAALSITKYQSTADGKFNSQAAAIDVNSKAISAKVSQSDYDAKTKDLDTKYTQVKETADSVTTDVASYKTANDKKVSANTAQLKVVSDEVSSKVSQTEYNQKTGQIDESVSQLKQRADGFESTVTKVNNLSVGGRNLLSHTNENGYVSLNVGNGTAANKYVPFINGYKSEFQWTKVSTNWSVWQQYGVVKERLKPDTDYTISFMINSPKEVTPRVGIQNAGAKNLIGPFTATDKPTVANKDTHMEVHFHSFKEDMFPDESDQSVYINGFMGIEGAFQIWDLKLEEGTIATTWTPAPEDVQSGIDTNASSITQISDEVKTKVTKSDYDKNNQALNSSISSVSQKADGIRTDVESYKQSNDGKVSSNTANIKELSTEVSAKVSQTDFNTVTGDLSNKYGQVKLTADTASADLASYKQSNDKSVSANTTAISATSKEVKSKVSQSDYDANKQAVSNSLSTLSQRADGFDLTVAKVNNLAVGGRNLLLDTSKIVTQQGAGADNVNGNFNAGGGLFTFSNKMNTGLFFNKDPKAKYTLSYDWSVEGDNPSGQFNPQLTNAPWGFGGVAVKPSETNKSGHSVTTFQTQPSWKDTSAWGIAFRQDHLVGKVTITNMKLEIGTVPTDWTPAPEDTDNALAVQQTAITANTDAIKLKASQTDLVAAKNEYTQKFADVNVQAGQITDSVTKLTSKMNNLGQVNQLFNTEFSPDFQGWQRRGDTIADTSFLSQYWYKFNGSNVLEIDTSKLKGALISNLVAISPSVPVSFSAYEKVATDFPGSVATRISFYDKNKNLLTTSNGSTATNSTAMTYVYENNITPPDTASYVSLVISVSASNSKVYLAKPMLSLTNNVGDYVPGNYNNNSLVESIRTQTDKLITQEISDRTAGDKSVLSQTDGMISSQITDYNRGVMSNIAAMADGIYANVSSVGVRYIRFNGQGNNENNGTHFKRIMVTDKNGKNVLSGLKATAPYGGTLNNPSGGTDGDLLNDNTYIQIQGYEPNADKYIQYDLGSIRYDLSVISLKMWTETRTYYNVTVQASADNNSWRTLFLDDIHCSTNQFYDETIRFGAMGSQGIMSLTDSSFSTMLTNHSGNVITAINGDTSGVTITGKQLTLDGNTTVTGDFYAKGGNFKNLNASNITAGTLNAANINVINLDVSSLSGNITNFMKSYWDGAYGEEVSIQSDRITFYTNLYRSNTTISEGQINMMVYNNYTKTSENIGGIRHTILPGAENQDYLNFYLDGWSNVGNNGSNAAAHGGDGIVFSVSDGSNNGNNGAIGTLLLEWDNELLANSQGQEKGWHFWDFTKVHDDFLVTPDGAYQGLLVSSANYNNTTYPAIMGNQKKNDGPGILMGSTEMYFMYKGDAYPLSLILKSAGWNL